MPWGSPRHCGRDSCGDVVVTVIEMGGIGPDPHTPVPMVAPGPHVPQSITRRATAKAKPGDIQPPPVLLSPPNTLARWCPVPCLVPPQPSHPWVLQVPSWAVTQCWGPPHALSMAGLGDTLGHHLPPWQRGLVAGRDAGRGRTQRGQPPHPYGHGDVIPCCPHIEYHQWLKGPVWAPSAPWCCGLSGPMEPPHAG